MPRNASAACAASRRASAKTTFRSPRITSAPGWSATSTWRARSKPRIDSQQDPVNIEASGSESEYRFANRYKDAKVEKAFFVPKLCNHCTHPACVQVCPIGATYKAQGRRGAHRPQVLHRLPVLRAGLSLRRALLQRRKGRLATSAPGAITASPRDCSRPASRSARSARASSAIATMQQSPISLFIRNNRVQVLKPETGNAPNVFYVGIDKDGDLMEPLIHSPRTPAASTRTRRSSSGPC